MPQCLRKLSTHEQASVPHTLHTTNILCYQSKCFLFCDAMYCVQHCKLLVIYLHSPSHFSNVYNRDILMSASASAHSEDVAWSQLTCVSDAPYQTV